jgi:GT2 family glycosyltransferase
VFQTFDRGARIDLAVVTLGTPDRSRGCLDALRGHAPRLHRVAADHVDKEYCTQVRCHGWDVALVPGARRTHGGSLSAPTCFRDHRPR